MFNRLNDIFFLILKFYADDAICLYNSFKSFYLYFFCKIFVPVNVGKHLLIILDEWRFSHAWLNIFIVNSILPITTNYVYIHIAYITWITKWIIGFYSHAWFHWNIKIRFIYKLQHIFEQNVIYLYQTIHFN